MRTALGVIISVVLVSAVHGAVVIDDFSDPGSSVVVAIGLTSPDPTLVKSTGAGILGGERDVLLDVAGAADLDSFIGTIGAGKLSFNSNSPGTVLTLQYDGMDSDIVGPPAGLVNAEGLGGVDLLAMGSYLYLNFGRIDGGGPQTTGLSIVVSDGMNTSVYSGLIPDSAVPMTYQALFSAFSNPSVLSAATSIELVLNPQAVEDVDFVLTEIGVPEPATLGLLGLGSLILIGRRRRA